MNDRSEITAGGVMCRCPKCGADLRDEEIRPESYHLYGYEASDHPVACRYGCGSAAHFSKLTGVYDMERDMTTAWHCPICEETWPRGI